MVFMVCVVVVLLLVFMAEVGFVVFCFRPVFRLHTRKPAPRCAAWEWFSEGTAQGQWVKGSCEAKTGAALRNGCHEADNTTHTMRDTEKQLSPCQRSAISYQR